jgi:hypothetical protein
LIGRLHINISGCINACGHHHVGLFTPWIRRALAGLSGLAKAQNSRPFYRLGRKLSPDHPKAARIVAMALLLVVASASALYLIIRVGTLDAASNLDQSVHGLQPSPQGGGSVGSDDNVHATHR